MEPGRLDCTAVVAMLQHSLASELWVCWPGLYSTVRYVTVCCRVELMKVSGGDPGTLYSMCYGMAWLESTGWDTENKKLQWNEGDSACSVSLKSNQVKSSQVRGVDLIWRQGRAGTGMDSMTLMMRGRTKTAIEEEWCYSAIAYCTVRP
jgi:hypothetical protein